MADTPAPDGARLPEAPIGLRSRPSDVVANPPVVKSPTPAPTTSPAIRPGVPIADTAALGAARAEQAATDGAEEPRGGPLTTDQIMPTCMIYAMFAGLALMLGSMLCWMFNAIGHFIH